MVSFVLYWISLRSTSFQFFQMYNRTTENRVPSSSKYSKMNVYFSLKKNLFTNEKRMKKLSKTIQCYLVSKDWKQKKSLYFVVIFVAHIEHPNLLVRICLLLGWRSVNTNNDGVITFVRLQRQLFYGLHLFGQHFLDLTGKDGFRCGSGIDTVSL